MRLLISGAFVVALLVPAGTAQAAPTVTATPLPVPAGTTDAAVSDVNNDGVAVGYATVDGDTQALRWSGTTVTTLPASTARPRATASRINDAGDAVGVLSPVDTSNTAVRRWSAGGATVDCVPSVFALGVQDANENGDTLITGITGPRRFAAAVCHADGTSTSTPLVIADGIGADGRVAGAQAGNASNNFAYLPTVVSATGTATVLPVPAGESGIAYDLGPGEAVIGAVGASVLGAPPQVLFNPRTAVIWSGGQITELGTLGGTTSRPADTGRAVNTGGDVIGTSTTASGQTHAFRWHDGTMTDLGTLGGTSSTPTAVNDEGQVVGYSTTASGDTHAFLWTDGELIDLGAPGGDASSAVDVNNSGVVVGSVTAADGSRRPVRWSVA